MNTCFGRVLFRNVQSSAAKSRYEFVEVKSPRSPRPHVARAKLRPLPVGLRALATVSSLPLQSYLLERFSHSVNGAVWKALRYANQHKHDLCAASGNWPMSRTS